MSADCSVAAGVDGTVVGAVGVMFVFSVPLTLVFLFFTALSLLVTKVVSRRTHDVTGERGVGIQDYERGRGRLLGPSGDSRV